MLIDHSGLRAPRTWEQLQKAGFSQVAVVKGGIAEWRKAGLPVATLEKQLEKERLEQDLVQQELDQLERELEQMRNN
jgi:3-mercaptopyruvate sulfurtransferase SseA